jgi:mannose-6-phosphate isomerase-like protein (cupin superfamily)
MSQISLRKKWDAAEDGPLTEDTIRRLHLPANRHRISRYEYLPGERVHGFGRSCRAYVLSGRCTVTIAGEQARLSPGAVADLPAGEYFMEVPREDEEALAIVYVWELPWEIEA